METGTTDTGDERSGAKRRPPSRAGLSKAHISSQPPKGTITCYRGASLLQVRLRTETKPGKSGRRTSTPRGEITEFSAASRRRMLEVMAKIEQTAVPFLVTLTYPDEFPMYRHDYKRHLEVFCDRLFRRWPGAAVVWKLEFQSRKSGANKGKIAPHYHMFVYGVPWAFEFKAENGSSFRLRNEIRDGQQWVELEVSSDQESMRRSRGCGGAFRRETEKDQALYEKILEQCPDVLGLDVFCDWVTRHWYDVVGSRTLSHFKAGTRVEKLRTSKGAVAYAAKRYVTKREEMPELEHKPGRFWGVVNRKHLPFGKREDREVSSTDAVQLRRVMRRYRVANTGPEKRKFLRKSQLWSQEFTAKLFCNVEFWLRCLPRRLPATATAHTM